MQSFPRVVNKLLSRGNCWEVFTALASHRDICYSRISRFSRDEKGNADHKDKVGIGEKRKPEMDDCVLKVKLRY